MNTYILKHQTITVKNEEIIRNSIIGAYATEELAKTYMAIAQREEMKKYNTGSVYIMSGSAVLIAGDTFGTILSIQELYVHEA